jgi:hypothetical protein
MWVNWMLVLPTGACVAWPGGSRQVPLVKPRSALSAQARQAWMGGHILDCSLAQAPEFLKGTPVLLRKRAALQVPGNQVGFNPCHPTTSSTKTQARSTHPMEGHAHS